MKSSTSGYNSIALSSNARYYHKVMLGETEITGDIMEIKLNGVIDSDELFSFGNAESSYIEFTTYTPSQSL